MPVVDVLSLTPARKTDYSIDFLDAARTGGKLLFKYYPDYWTDNLTAMWQSAPLAQVPNERHNSVWGAISTPFSHIMSANGTKALYHYQNSGGSLQLYLVDLNSGAKTFITQPIGTINYHALSPDGTVARWSSGGYNAARLIFSTGDLRDTFSSRYPESSTVGAGNLTDFTADNRYYYMGSEPATTSYIHRVDMIPATTAPAPDITAITFGQSQLAFGDTTPVTITIQVSDPKGLANIQSVQMHTMVDGRELLPDQVYEPLTYTKESYWHIHLFVVKLD